MRKPIRKMSMFVVPFENFVTHLLTKAALLNRLFILSCFKVLVLVFSWTLKNDVPYPGHYSLIMKCITTTEVCGWKKSQPRMANGLRRSMLRRPSVDETVTRQYKAKQCFNIFARQKFLLNLFRMNSFTVKT